MMTRERSQMINREALAALEAIARKYNMAVQPKGGRYDDNQTTLKFSFADTTTDGTPMTREFQELRRRHPEIAGYTFYIPGTGYVKPIGYNTRARKMPVIYEDLSSGKTYKTSEFFLQKCTEDRRSEET